ncbi:protein-ADP-ribose hydrolase [Bifidobacterium sp. 64T4]|nr:protein-ADP-ribose hydrolase [Bifidobacterium pongonis]MBW3095297.1 protein-ADP-ribose hydrolase [Bifidobacterium pongonis]
MNQDGRRLLLLQGLLDERRAWMGDDANAANITIPNNPDQQRVLLRALMNVREPHTVNEKLLRIQDEYLHAEIAAKGITDIASLAPLRTVPGVGTPAELFLWQGDITTLACDAIVNAANSGMTGCYVPNHRCIDNAIHTYAGMELRLACEELMERQGYPEPTGQAEITPAFNLPCRYVLHTVGPIVEGHVTDEHDRLLASCYHSCLAVAAEQGLESVAFCCISTGEFRFPNERAAVIAVHTVEEFMAEQTSVRKVVFNVFKDTDRAIYERLLRAE